MSEYLSAEFTTKPHVRFDERILEIWYDGNIVTLKGNRELRGTNFQPMEPTAVFCSTILIFIINVL